MLALLFVLASCKGKPEHREPPSKAPAGSGAPLSKGRPDVTVPTGDGSPPKRTTGHLDAATCDKLRGLEFPTFTKDPTGTNNDSVAAIYRTEGRPKLKVSVQVQPCKGTCIPLEVSKWQNLPDLKEFMPKALADSKDTQFEVGATTLDGVAMIYTFQLGVLEAPEGFHYTDTYVLYYNDGINKIRAVATYSDNKPVSRDAMLVMAPKEDLEALAKAFLDAFTHVWAT